MGRGVLEFQMPGIIKGYFEYKNLASIFWRWLDLNRDLFGYSKQSEDSCYM